MKWRVNKIERDNENSYRQKKSNREIENMFNELQISTENKKYIYYVRKNNCL